MKYLQSTSYSTTLIGALLLTILTGCSSSNMLQHPTTSATLWMQNSAEYGALSTAMYQSAISNLGLAIEDSHWTAYPPQDTNTSIDKDAAVILDVDETVLNNSGFQARMIKQNSSFDPEQWNSWVMEANATAIPGALAFTKRAAQEGVTVFYLTNREAKVEEGTRQNLQELGFPLSENEDRILSKNERDNWTSAKTERRAYVAQNHRILMLFGDDLNDFISAKGITQQQREQLVQDHQNKWGRKWYVLPNPVYGSWEDALHNFDDSLSPAQVDSAKKARLDSRKQ
ncbi:MAG: HAD family acid phosphatase [Fodinibius sp.]|nr:HAD family acid phosphatase [Fodinibius sp.]